MIRVGFRLTHTDSSWVGGINYLLNLLSAIRGVEDRQVEPVLILPSDLPTQVLQQFVGIAKIPGPALATTRAQRVGQRLWRSATGVDRALEGVLRREGIRVISHSWHVDRSPDITALEWIPDFQHRHLPSFFSTVELERRDRTYEKLARSCSRLILSSHAAQRDLAEFCPDALAKSAVLRFCSSLGEGLGGTPTAALRVKYEIDGDYFHLPNQFWAHKNHRVVVDALAAVAHLQPRMTVLCTGHTRDYRHPEYFESLMQHVTDKGLEHRFRVLGLVPLEDLHGLMRDAVALINPSLFEGWSSSVEEAKALGKMVLLSDLPVHREQAPTRGVFFDPNDCETLAAAMGSARERLNAALEQSEREKAAKSQRQVRADFGRAYQDIVVSAAATR